MSCGEVRANDVEGVGITASWWARQMRWVACRLLFWSISKGKAEEAGAYSPGVALDNI